MSVSESTEQYAKKSSIKSTISSHLKSTPVFVLCEKCYWSVTFLDYYRLREEGVGDHGKKCPRCESIDSLSSLPITTNESFTFSHTAKRGIELEFKRRI